MKHLGDITKINGAAATPVNVIIGGSPCQDLSVAGKRAGLAGERSGLFMEQLRIIKEMRKADADNGRTGKQIRPRYMVWENVPGAFSSNKGADFGAVLQETIRVVCKEAPVIPVPKNGWPLAGCLYGESGEWSLAWRVFDAQFWGVPQRRRRIALIADFGGTAAPEILFEREGVSGYYPQGRTPWETATRSAEAGFGDTVAGNSDRMSYCIQGNCIDRADTAGCNGKGWTKDVSYTLNTVDRPAVAPVNVPLSDVASTLRAGAGAPKHESDIKGRLVISQPITLAGVLFDEVALMPRSFVEQAMARCSVEGSKFWFNCNPENPGHWFYTEWIKKAKERNILYLHFTMNDNLSLSEKIKARYEGMYTGVFYRRYILGLWVKAEGLVYPMFNRSNHIVRNIPAVSPRHRYYVAVDYGTVNPFAAGLYDYSPSEQKAIMIKELYYKGGSNNRVDNEAYYKMLGELIGDYRISNRLRLKHCRR